MLAECGALSDMIAAGARVLECTCGPCIGMGQSPKSAGVSLRTFNRNFTGRSGTKDAEVYLVSPEVAAYSAICGYLADPREIGGQPNFPMPKKFLINDNMIAKPASAAEAEALTTVKGPNIKDCPIGTPVPEKLECECVLKVGDNITTDHIMPAGAKILPYRSNIPYLSKFCFAVCDESFPERAKAKGQGIIIGGSNYGQGSSREHAALVPLYLGIKAVIAKSFARIHADNLVNAGIMPLTFANPEDYDKINEGDLLSIEAIADGLDSGKLTLAAGENKFELCANLSERQKAMIKAGGLLAATKG